MSPATTCGLLHIPLVNLLMTTSNPFGEFLAQATRIVPETQCVRTEGGPSPSAAPSEFSTTRPVVDGPRDSHIPDHGSGSSPIAAIRCKLGNGGFPLAGDRSAPTSPMAA